MKKGKGKMLVRQENGRKEKEWKEGRVTVGMNRMRRIWNRRNACIIEKNGTRECVKLKMEVDSMRERSEETVACVLRKDERRKYGKGKVYVDRKNEKRKGGKACIM